MYLLDFFPSLPLHDFISAFFVVQEYFLENSPLSAQEENTINKKTSVNLPSISDYCVVIFTMDTQHGELLWEMKQLLVGIYIS